MTAKLYSVADLSALVDTSATQLSAWRGKWSTFPEPAYTNQRGMTPLWSVEDKDTILALVAKYRAAKAL